MIDSEVARQPVRAMPLKAHKFGDPISVAASFELERHAQTERTCNFCGAVKVTVHPPEGGGRREWRASASSVQGLDEPICEMKVDVAELMKP